MELVMTDMELLEALNLDHPGLEEVRAALKAGDHEAAKARVVHYFRMAKEFEEAPKRVDPEDRPEAISERGEALYERYAGGDEDWFSVAHPEDVPEREYSTQVMFKNDHNDLAALAQAYCETGNYKYAQTCIRAMSSWVEAMAPLPETPPTGQKAPMWRTIYYSTPRAVNWTRCFFQLRDYPGLSVDEWMVLLKVILHHQRYAAANEVPGMPNMVIHLFERLIHFGLQWPEMIESSSWIEKGVTGLHALLDDYFYPDGAYIELSYFAHEVFVSVARMGEQKVISLPKGFHEKVERIFDFPVYMVKPNGEYPTVNDNYSAQDPEEISQQRGGLVQMGLEFLNRADLRYIHTYGREGAPPPYTSRAFPYAGFYVMRSDWSAEARYLVFDGGKSAGGHNHVDKLSFELYAYGNTLVTDTGCGGPWASAWRSEYFVGTAGHNTIMVDGRGQVAGVPLFEIPSLAGRTPWHEIAPEPLPNTWKSGTHFDYAASCYEDGYGDYGSEQNRMRGFHYEQNRVGKIAQMQLSAQAQKGDLRVKPHQRLSVVHGRKVFFAKPDYWILSDRLLGKGRHRVESMFHFQTSATAQIEEGERSVRTVNGRAGLTILPISEADFEVRIVSGQQHPLQGWVPAGWGHHRPAPMAIYSLEEDLPVAIDTVLYPYPKDKIPELSAHRLEVTENGDKVEPWEASGLCIRVNGQQDYYVRSYDRRALRCYGPVSCDGEVALIRCDKEGEIRRLSLVRGSYVEIAGRTIVAAEDTFEFLELTWERDTLEVRSHPRIAATVWAGDVRQLRINTQGMLPISSAGGQIRIFENWLD